MLNLVYCTSVQVAGSTVTQFTLVVSASDTSINGTALVATNDNEIDIMGTLEPVQENESPSIFYFDSSTSRLVTDSALSGEERFAYTIYDNYTSSVRFDIGSNISGDIAYPIFTISEDGDLISPGNLTWAWCPDEFNVGNGYYLPGSITLGDVAEGCEAIDGLTAVDATV